MAMKQKLNELRDRYEARPRAEKGIMLAVSLMVIFWLYVIGVSDPLAASVTALDQQILTAQVEVSALKARQQEARQAGENDPNLFVREQLEELVVAEATARQQLEEINGSVISATTMNRLLSEVLGTHDGLRLVRLENRPAERLVGNDLSETAQLMYRHGLVLEFEGDYLSLLKYLVYLEGLSENFFWESLSITPGQWPASAIRMELSALSPEESFVGI
jgi:MSHA biogenesis protein MshJ